MVEAATKDKKAVGPFSWTYTWKTVTKTLKANGAT